jgi:hypothetical protein
MPRSHQLPERLNTGQPDSNYCIIPPSWWSPIRGDGDQYSCAEGGSKGEAKHHQAFRIRPGNRKEKGSVFHQLRLSTRPPPSSSSAVAVTASTDSQIDQDNKNNRRRRKNLYFPPYVSIALETMLITWRIAASMLYHQHVSLPTCRKSRVDNKDKQRYEL